MKTYHITGLLLLSLFTFIACNSTPQPNGINETSIPQPNGETAKIYHLSNADFKKKLDETQEAQLIDIRTDGEVRHGMLPHATQMNISTSKFGEQVATLDKNRPVFLYCAGGGRSKQAANSLSAWGFNVIYELNEGYDSWEKDNLPVEKK